MDEVYEEVEMLLEELQERIKDEYRRAAQDINNKLLEYQKQFRDKNIKKLDDLRNGKISPREYENWYKGQVLIGQRWIDMRESLSADMMNYNKIAMSIISDYLTEAYAINHNYSTFLIERDSRLNTSYTLYDKSTVERLIRENPELLPSPSVNENKDLKYNRQVATSAILQGILQGEDIYQIAKRLPRDAVEYAAEELFSSTASQTIERRLRNAAVFAARTMITSAQNAGRIDGMRRAEKMGIKTLKVWLATPDSRVRDSHARLDGEEKEVEEEFSNGCRYPGDPNGAPDEVCNCRCTLITQVKGTPRIDLSSPNRRLDGLSRDYVNGENMTYQDWKDYHSDNPQIREAARAKWQESSKSRMRKRPKNF